VHVDALVEFCRTGELSGLRLGMTVPEVESILGPPKDTRWMHGDEEYQQYRYGSLTLWMFHDNVDRYVEGHLLANIIVRFSEYRPLNLPETIVQHLDHSWENPTIEDTLSALADAGIRVTLEREYIHHDRLHQSFRTGNNSASIVAFDGKVDVIEK